MCSILVTGAVEWSEPLEYGGVTAQGKDDSEMIPSGQTSEDDVRFQQIEDRIDRFKLDVLLS